MYTDRSFIHPAHKSAQLHQKALHSNLFLYYFSYKGSYSFTPLFSQSTKDFGEIQKVFVLRSRKE
jgi:hypothetical protein